MQTVYYFIAEFHKTPIEGRENMTNAIRVLWIGRVGAFIKQTMAETREQTEAKVRQEVSVFRQQKPYLLSKY